MKIAIMGAGGVGGYFGGLLARAGEDVSFVARGFHLDGLRQQGLSVRSDVSGEFSVSVTATADPGRIGPADVVLYTVKMHHNEQAIPAIGPMVGPDTVILTIQNGVDNGEKLAAAYPNAHVMIGSAFIQARVVEPGVIVQQGKLARVVFGEMSGGVTERGRLMFNVFERAGWDVELSDNTPAVVWQKYIYLCGSASVNAASRTTYGEMRAVPSTRELLRALFVENAAVAKASGITFAHDPVQRAMELLDGFPADGRASLAKDFADGNTVELEGLTGTTIRLGRELGVPTPLNAAMYAVLEPAAIKIARARGAG